MYEYDFYINEDNHLIIPELDVDYLYSVSESTRPYMGEIEEATVRIAGRPGEIVLDAEYQPLLFTLVAYTDENLEPKEKVEEINKIKNYLHSIRKTNKKLAFLQDKEMYSVKYNNQLTITNYPKSVRFSIPLKASFPYGTELFKKIITGNGYKISKTVETTGCEITINGPANNPVISLNDYQMQYNNVVLAGNKLIIDTNNSTITHITSQGVKTNAAIYYNHEYPKIEYGKNEIKILAGINDETQVTTEWYDLKL